MNQQLKWYLLKFSPSLLIGFVLYFNIQCALLFFFSPEQYAPSFGLESTVGTSMIQALAVLFVMWNVPYSVAFIQPRKYRVSLIEAVIMQAIGVFGELIIISNQPGLPTIVKSSIQRFVIFDSLGLILLLAALGISFIKYGAVHE